MKQFNETHLKEFYLNISKTFTNSKVKVSHATNFYKDYFKQGATIVPRNFYFVESKRLENCLSKTKKPNIKIRTFHFQTNESLLKDAKMPWKGFKLSGRVNSNFLFITALSKNIIPFGLLDTQYVLLPIKIDSKENTKMIKLLSSDDILNLGEIDSAKWFRNAEKIWKENKTEKSEKISSLDRLNFQRGITDQDLNKKYIVLYNSSAKDANSTILIRHNYELDFIVESAAYAFYTNSLEEANYINCFLNCSYANTIIKDFQVRGLYEARDVHKKILEVPFPQYNRKNKSHTDLAELGEVCYKKTKIFLGDNVKEDIAPHRLRALRLE